MLGEDFPEMLIILRFCATKSLLSLQLTTKSLTWREDLSWN